MSFTQFQSIIRPKDPKNRNVTLYWNHHWLTWSMTNFHWPIKTTGYLIRSNYVLNTAISSNGHFKRTLSLALSLIPKNSNHHHHEWWMRGVFEPYRRIFVVHTILRWFRTRNNMHIESSREPKKKSAVAWLNWSIGNVCQCLPYKHQHRTNRPGHRDTTSASLEMDKMRQRLIRMENPLIHWWRLRHDRPSAIGSLEWWSAHSIHPLVSKPRMDMRHANHLLFIGVPWMYV